MLAPALNQEFRIKNPFSDYAVATVVERGNISATDTESFSDTATENVAFKRKVQRSC